jgi:co-chaperonin GroES (HSP10)
MSLAPHRIHKLRALRDHVIVEDMNFEGRTLTSGIILPSDNGKSSGIRPRWGRVYAVGPEHRDVTVGQWICVAHGRWTRGVTIEDDTGIRTIRRIDADDILLVTDQQPDDDTMSDAVVVPERA